MDHYVIRVDGALPDNALQDFANVSVTAGSVQTVLHGDLPDQSSLAGILDYLDALGVEIVEVLKVPRERRSVSDEAEIAGDPEGS
ncbi:MAG TPA: hypothetical protein VH419_00525 [Nocardioidaceae bacterium]|jgi:hypothetical protein